MTIELGRVESPNKPYAFDGRPQQYSTRGEQGKPGVAVLRWDEVEKLRAEFLQATPTPGARKRMGDLLRGFLVDVLKELDGWSSYEKALLKAEAKKASLRLRFRFSAGELFSLPWSLTALHNGRSLGNIKPHPLQFEWAHDLRASLASPSHGRVLFAWSDAGDYVSEERHLAALQKACPDFDCEQDELANLNLDSLRDKLEKARQEGRPFRILHILCHGGPIPGGTFGLIWTDPNHPRRPMLVDGDRLRDVLGPYQGDLQAVVLSACHGSNPGQVGSMFGGVAHDLHRLGIPAVIASQMPLTVNGSIQMTEALYEALCQRKFPIDVAFQKAHEALSASSLDWASLQFFAPSPPVEARTRGQRIVFSPDAPIPELPEELAVAYEVNFNVAPASMVEALEGRAGGDPDIVALQPFGRVADDLPNTTRDWRRALKQADQLVNRLGTDVSMVHLFGRAPLPLMFHLGWRLSRWKLRVYQEERGRTGRWTCGYDSMQKPSSEERFFREEAWPDSKAYSVARGRLAMTIEVNLSIHPEELAKWLGTENPPALVRLVAARGTSPTVVRGPMDTARAVDEFRAYLDRIHAEWRDASEVWLAMACPASLAAALGRAYNPKSQPTVKLFNFRKSEGYVEVPWTGGVTRKPGRRS
ncbi:MAG TPA: SAVED domain-containing protein [Archangium sp.]|uniref:SAVED domain-containing protein n=1 Tax=Archangium sp. TaxID=1872627 RepID=UPI002E36ABDA|nr:SAVED domain-containing protein [Archangium sp.]HEX5750684.1 SAVED domain-containing protein [Archangium sp.]